MPNDQILISRQAYEKLMQLTQLPSPKEDATVGELYFNEAKRQLKQRIERWFTCA